MAALNLYIFLGKIGSSVINGFRNFSFGSHCSANFQPILDCFIPKFKLKYDDLENIKIDLVNTVVFNLLQIKQSTFVFGTPGIFKGYNIQYIQSLQYILKV